MKKNIKLRTWALCLALVMVLTSLVLVNAFANGETCDCGGTYDNGFCGSCGDYQPAVDSDGDGYYEIGNAGQLYWFADYVNAGNTSANAKLGANIVVNTGVLNADGNLNSGDFRSWTPIGNSSRVYTGTFDGQNYTISGLYCNNGGSYIGLFGYIGSGAVIKNLGVLDSYFYGSEKVGGVVGYNYYGTIQLCYTASYVCGGYDAGGIAGYNYGTVENCYSHSRVYGDDDAGGIVGENQGPVRNCYSMGSISCSSNYYGGIAGYGSGSVTNCYYLEGSAGYGSNYGYRYGTEQIREAFAAGDVAGRLGNAYGQLLGTDDYPVFRTEANTLYPCALCPNKTDGYSNDPDHGNATEHTYEDGMCIYCGEAIPPEQDEDGYYIITTVGELYWFANHVNSGNTSANAKLGANIVVNTGVLDEDGYLNEGDFRTWEPIGSGRWHEDEGEDENGNWYYNEWQEVYTGHFNGQGFTIYGLFCNKQSTSNIGLFGYIGSEAKVENVNVADSYFYGYCYVGGIVGYNGHGIVDNCSGDNYVKASYKVYIYEDEWDSWEEYNYGNYTGGIVGYNYGIVKNCSNSGVVWGYNYVGGIAGGNWGTVERCSNSAQVRGNGSEDESYYVGGIVGYNSTSVMNCYNSGAVDGDLYVGGIVGCSAEEGAVTKCYNTGYISGRRTGGIAGTNEGFVENCYNQGTIDSDTVGGLAGLNYGTIRNCYSSGQIEGYSGDSSYGSLVGYSSGIVENSYYLEGCTEGGYDYGTPKTEEEFASGEVMLLLGEAFGQDLSKGEKWPTLGGPRYTMIVVFTNGEEVYYADLAEAVAAAKEDAGCTLIMLADSFKGEALINAGNFNLEFRGNQMNSTLVVAENANITIKNGKFTNITAQNGGRITINGENVTLAGVLKAEEGEITIIEAAVEAGLKLMGITLNEILDRNSFGRNEDGEVTTAVTKIRVIRPGASLDEATIVVDNAPYTGDPIPAEKLVITVTIGGKTLMLGKDFEIVGLANNTALGINTAEVTIRAIAPYTGEKTLKFSIVNCATDFGAQIKELEERLKALEDSNELSDAIKAAIEAIYAELEQIQSNYATIEELEAAIVRIEALEDAIAALENRVTSNESAIEELRQQLAQVQEDVMKALNSGNADLANQIERLKATIHAAIAANATADAQTKAELTALIRAAETTLQTAIDKVAADLEQAKLDVNAAILAGDADLAQKIAELQSAMDTATAVSNAADNALKAELADAVATLNAALVKLQNDFDNAAEQAKRMAVIAFTLVGVGAAVCVGLVIFIVIDKRKLVK